MSMSGLFPQQFKTEERLVYISAGGETYPLHSPPWRVVLQEEGFGVPPIEYVVDRAPFQHGDTVRSFYLGPRPIQLVVLHNFCSRAEYWQGRNDLIDILRPTIGEEPPRPGTLVYYMSGGKRRALNILLDSGPGFVPSEGGWREWSFTEALRFTAHDPVWFDPAARSQTLLYVTPATELVFPATFPIFFSETAGLVNSVFYNGTWLEYPVIHVTGPVTGFTVTNLATGMKLGLTQPVLEDYTVTFDLRGIKTVTGSDGVNWSNAVSADSNLTSFALVPSPAVPAGVNEFLLGGTGTDNRTRVVVEYFERYMGI